MLATRDWVRIARQRAGLTQQQLAERSNHPRETIARWETGAREPSLESLQALINACDLDLVIHLAEGDSSLDEAVLDQLEVSPRVRLERYLSAGAAEETLRLLGWVAVARASAIVVGGLAAVLQGGPRRPSSVGVELLAADNRAMERELIDSGYIAGDVDQRWAARDRRAPWTHPEGGVVALASDLPGSHGYRDLRRSAVTVDVEDAGALTVAHPRDLLRIADASPADSDRAQVPALRALLSAFGSQQ